MFDFTSRYANQETMKFTTEDGQTLVYARRRFLPQGEAMPLLAEIALEPRERLDVFTNRTLGDPLQFWRIADANNAINPFDLTEENEFKRVLRVPVPQPGG